MRRLTSHTGDRGAVAVTVSLLLVAMLGMGAYVIDVGALFQERRDLQNGADAAALALAYDCVNGGGSRCQANNNTAAEADRLASMNSDDGSATVTRADIDFTGNSSSGTVEVTVHTEDASDGDADLDFVLAPVLGTDSASVAASATATWGAPEGAATIPIVISSCEWDEATSEGTTFGEYEIIYLHDSGQDPTPCQFGPGQDIDGDGDRAEGGFGYLETDNCVVYVNAGGFAQGSTGTGNPSHLGCNPSDILGQRLHIPIFDDIPDSTPNGCAGPSGTPCYHIYGFAEFEVLDIDFNGFRWRNRGNICPSAARCLGGRFVKYVALDTIGDLGGPNLGLAGVQLTG